MRNITLLFCLVLASIQGNAQEYKITANSGRLEITEVNRVSIEGHSGNEIIFRTKEKATNDPRAKGLRSITSSGVEDNTGLGLSVVQRGNIVEVHQMKRTNGPEVTILVPKGVSVSYDHSSPYGSKLEIRNFDGNVEVSTVHNSVTLENLKGRLKIKTVHGHIDAQLPVVTEPVALISVHGRVDVSLPTTVKADLTMSTGWGEILVDPDLKIAVERAGEFVKYNGDVNGKLNGGGTSVELSSEHNNVYLRKRSVQ